MQVTQTQRNFLTGNADEGRSESIISTHKKYEIVYSTPFLNITNSEGIKDLGFTRIHGDSRYNLSKQEEIADRVSM